MVVELLDIIWLRADGNRLGVVTENNIITAHVCREISSVPYNIHFPNNCEGRIGNTWLTTYVTNLRTVLFRIVLIDNSKCN